MQKVIELPRPAGISRLDKFIVVLSDLLTKRRKLDSKEPQSTEEWRYYYTTSINQQELLIKMHSDLLAELDALSAKEDV